MQSETDSFVYVLNIMLYALGCSAVALSGTIIYLESLL